MPRARDSTTSTSENLSITIPGRKSASPKITRQLVMSSMTFFRYSQAFLTRMVRKVSSISVSMFLVIMRTVNLEFRLINPRPMGYPSKS